LILETNQMDERVGKIEQNISVLTTRVDDLSLRLAVKDEREKRVEEKLQDIKADVEKLNQVATRVGWLVIVTIVGAVLKFILEGGLRVGP
jgi:archaellum component FlaC